jgi:hypothetical protein
MGIKSIPDALKFLEDWRDDTLQKNDKTNEESCNLCEALSLMFEYIDCKQKEVNEKTNTIDFLKKQVTDWCDSYVELKEDFQILKQKNTALEEDILVKEESIRFGQNTCKEWVEVCDELQTKLKTVKVETIKSFTEKLKNEVTYHVDECDEFVPWVDCRDIDKLAEEEITKTTLKEGNE